MEQNSKENKRGYKRITIEGLRKFEGLKNLTYEEADEAIIALKKLSVIMYEFWQKDLSAKSR